MPFCSAFSPGLAVVLFFDSCCKMMFCHEFTYCRVSSTITLSVCLQKKKIAVLLCTAKQNYRTYRGNALETKISSLTY